MSAQASGMPEGGWARGGRRLGGGLLLAFLTACGGDSPQGIAAAESIEDPLLVRQWHLLDSDPDGSLPVQGLNLAGLARRGAGISIAIVDGAVQIRHPDLAANHLGGRSYNYLDGSADPGPAADRSRSGGSGAARDAHGTAIAGIVAARDGNGLGGRGVAPRAGFMAFNALAAPSDANMADAMRRAVRNGADVVNNSWGPIDPSEGGTRSYYPASAEWREAVGWGVARGRGGRGAVYVIAAGNGGADDDDSNRNGYANFRGVLAVGAVDARGRPATYTEPGANVLVAAPSGDFLGRHAGTPGILTTDLAGPQGYASGTDPASADYATVFAGTSASTGMVSGVVALMLEANPALGWRDVRWLLARTAAPADLLPWAAEPAAANANGFHPRVGFGRVDAAAAVSAAGSFGGLGPAQQCGSGVVQDGRVLPDNDAAGLALGWNAVSCPLGTVEFVEVWLQTDHPYSGDLRVELASPAGRVSRLAAPHTCAGQRCTWLADGWTFGSVRHLGEPAAGNWILRIRDEREQDTGRIQAWSVVLHGH